MLPLWLLAAGVVLKILSFTRGGKVMLLVILTRGKLELVVPSTPLEAATTVAATANVPPTVTAAPT